MKEYKIVSLKLGSKNRTQKYKDLLNQYVKKGWGVHSIFKNTGEMFFERAKNS